MSWLRFLSPLGGKRRLADHLTSQVVLRSHELTRQTLLDRARRLPPVEARGYLRAGTRIILARQSRLVFEADEALAQSLKQQIMSAALEQVVSLMMSEMSSSGNAQRQAPLRRAA